MSNPLLDVMKSTRKYINLPSEGKFYADGVLSNGHEIAISSMSAKDEIMFKNPDALIGGEAVMNLIRNCTTGINKPEELNHIDVEMILLAIKSASGENKIEYNVECPSCSHKGSVELNIESTLEQAKRLKDEYKHVLDNGIIVYLSPHAYKNHIDILTLVFQQKTLLQVGEQSDSSDVHKQVIKEMRDILTEMKFSNILFAISSVKHNDTEYTDPTIIKEFVDVLSTNDAEAIEEIINSFSECGVSNSVVAVCSSCNHEWEQSLAKFDPTGFFSERSVNQN